MTLPNRPQLPATADFKLRLINLDDAWWISKLHSDRNVMRYISGGTTIDAHQTKSKTLPKLMRFNQSSAVFGFFAVIDKRNQPLGWLHLKPWLPKVNDWHTQPLEGEIGYRLLPQYWGKGVATTMATALSSYCFECLGFATLYAHTLQTNLASQKVLLKSGFHHSTDFSYTAELLPDLPASERAAYLYLRARR